MSESTEVSESEIEAATSSSAQSSTNNSDREVPGCLKTKPFSRKYKARDTMIECKKNRAKETKRTRRKTQLHGGVQEQCGNRKAAEANDSEKESRADEEAPAVSSDGEDFGDEDSSSSTDLSTTDDEESSAGEDTASVASGWSLSEDIILRSMRRGGESWTEIGECLGKAMEDVRARWKMLDEEVKAHRESELRRKRQKVKEPRSKRTKKAQTTEPERQIDQESAEEVEEEEEEDETSEASSSTEAPDARSASIPPSNDDANKDSLQQTYLHHSIRSELYPQRFTLTADSALSQRDCDILAVLGAQHHHTRWLAMQAHFYNTTGRMLPLDLLRRRCEAAEWEALRRSLDEQGCGDLADRVENWLKGFYA